LTAAALVIHHLPTAEYTYANCQTPPVSHPPTVSPASHPVKMERRAVAQRPVLPIDRPNQVGARFQSCRAAHSRNRCQPT
jgi:hypothetical protein